MMPVAAFVGIEASFAPSRSARVISVVAFSHNLPKAMANPALTEDAVSPGAVAWVLTSTALVFLMTAGLGFFYGGLVRDTNIINTMMMSVVSMGIVTLTWVVFGFSWAFGDNGSTGFGMFVGNFDYSLWMDLDMKMWGDSGLPALVFAAFQMTFAIISSAIISGSLVERMRFSAYCIMLALWSLLIYAPLCHWVWGPGGWIGEMGALDFAGGTVVHISSGVSGLVAGGILGPRRHVEKDLGPANVPFVILGWLPPLVRLVGIQRRFCSVRHRWSCSPCSGHNFRGVSLIHADLVGPGAHLEGASLPVSEHLLVLLQAGGLKSC